MDTRVSMTDTKVQMNLSLAKARRRILDTPPKITPELSDASFDKLKNSVSLVQNGKAK
jgi:hypothetical protein